MSALQLLRVAISAVLRNKLRSTLTVLGVVIGVSAVIAMVAIGEGAKREVEAAFSSLGSNMLIVSSGSSNRGGARGGAGTMPSITYDDIDAIQAELPGARYVAPVLNTSATVIGGQLNWSTKVNGTGPDYFPIRSWDTQLGALFDQSDVRRASQVVVLGQTVVQELFGYRADPIGETVRLNNVPFTVVGVLEEKGQSAMGEEYDDAVFVPYTTYTRRIQGGLNQYMQGTLYVGTESPEDLSAVETGIAALLRDRHGIGPDQDDDFNVRNMTEFAAARAEGTETFTTLLAAIAAVSLLVGGIGIMNIMLVSVTERTREIGLRMALGATPFDILAQFLVEALVLSLFGGLVGVGVGIWTAEYLAEAYSWQIYIDPRVVSLALGFSAAVGVVFGLYPARQASKLSPIDALRYE